MALIWIKKAKYISDYIIEFTFSNDKTEKVDLQKYIEKGIFAELKNLEKFKNFNLNSWTIEWENGADFSPEFLYSLVDNKELTI